MYRCTVYAESAFLGPFPMRKAGTNSHFENVLLFVGDTSETTADGDMQGYSRSQDTEQTTCDAGNLCSKVDVTDAVFLNKLEEENKVEI